MAKKPANVSADQPLDLEQVLSGFSPKPVEQVKPVGTSGSAEANPPDEQEALPPEPLITLPAEVFTTPQEHGSFSDDPPEGWGAGEGNVRDPDPVTSQLDPVAAARASLLEDAARAREEAAPKAPTTVVPVTQRGSRVPEIRQALARAAAQPNTTKYRSRVTIGAAYQYDGKLHVAPDFIDRNWAAYEDGPAIMVPEAGLVKAGQWLVIQEVLADDGTVSFTELKVYDDAVFRSLFMAEATNAENTGTSGKPADR